MIKRILEEKIISYLQDFPAVAILGPRQVGKTTLAKLIASKIKKECVLLDLEKPKHLEPLKNDTELFLEKIKDKCVIIDEVQRYPEIFPILRPIIDDYRKPGRFLLLGSASPTLLKKSSESLMGRIAYTELSPLHLLEIAEKEDRDIVLDLWTYGGFPEQFLMKKKESKNAWHELFLSSYFEKELPLLGLGVAPDILQRTFTMLAHSQGAISNINNLSNSLGLDRRSLDQILSFFKRTYMVRELPPFFVNGKKRLIKSPKYYIRDSGLLHHSLGINNLIELFKHPIVGASWEGFIIEQVINLKTRLLPYFYRTRSGTECDLVLVKGNQPFITIEAKNSATPKVTKGMISSMEYLGTEHNFIVTPSVEFAYKTKENVTICNLHSLLNTIQKLG